MSILLWVTEMSKLIIAILCMFLLSQSANAHEMKKKFEQLRVDVIKDYLVILKTREEMSEAERLEMDKKIDLVTLKKPVNYEMLLLDSVTSIIVKLGGTAALSDTEMKQLDGIVPPLMESK